MEISIRFQLAAQWRFLLRNLRALVRHFSIQFDVIVPLFRDVVFVEDGLDRALWNAGSAIDAFFRIDEQHRLALVKTFGRTNDYAVRVLAAETGFRDNHGHDERPLAKRM
jgi:hypothetical protein